MENVEGYRSGMQTKITAGGIPFKKLPKSRLSEAIEFLKPELEIIVLGKLGQTELAVVIWCLTTCKPNAKMQTYRCTTDLEWYLRLRPAYIRNLNAGNVDINCANNVLDAENVKDFVFAYVIKWGFDPAWLDKK